MVPGDVVEAARKHPFMRKQLTPNRTRVGGSVLLNARKTGTVTDRYQCAPSNTNQHKTSKEQSSRRLTIRNKAIICKAIIANYPTDPPPPWSLGHLERGVRDAGTRIFTEGTDRVSKDAGVCHRYGCRGRARVGAGEYMPTICYVACSRAHGGQELARCRAPPRGL
jgi:hypothetical protein